MKASDTFAAIYHSHHRQVLRVVGQVAPDDDTADDWAQEAWIRIFKGLGAFQGNAALGTWIHRVALRTAISLRRTQRRRASLLERWNASNWLVDPVDTHELSWQLQQAFDKLPPSMQTVVRLHDIEGFRHREIAVRLDVAESTSRSQLFEARLRMRSALTGVSQGRRRTA